MRLSSEAIREFKKIYEDQVGEQLSDVQTEQGALRLLRLFRTLSQPTVKERNAFLPASPEGTHKQKEVR